jgi:hypothetical protein
VKEQMVETAIQAKLGVVPSQPYTYGQNPTFYYVTPTTGR